MTGSKTQCDQTEVFLSSYFTKCIGNATGSTKFERLVSPSFFILCISSTQITEAKLRFHFQFKMYIRKHKHSRHLYNKPDSVLTFLTCENLSPTKHICETPHIDFRGKKKTIPS